MPLTATALRLRILRTKRHLSQQEMADILGITRTAYNKYGIRSRKTLRTTKE